MQETDEEETEECGEEGGRELEEGGREVQHNGRLYKCITVVVLTSILHSEYLIHTCCKMFLLIIAPTCFGLSSSPSSGNTYFLCVCAAYM
jgi:hypothetical protein